MSEPPCKSENELDRLSTEELLDYIVDQRDGGRPECAKPALGLLAFGYWGLVLSIISEKVPAEHVEEQAAIVIESALRSAFDGKSVGQFVSWLKVIARRQIANYWRKREGKPKPEPLPSEHLGDEAVWGTEPGREDGEVEATEFREAAGRVLEQRDEIHQMVIRLYGPNPLGYLDLSADETCEGIEGVHPGTGMTAANVHQIWHRFKVDLGEQLGLAGS